MCTNKVCDTRHWGDTNVVLILSNQERIIIKCPDRIGVEEDQWWLSGPTEEGGWSDGRSRSWNTDMETVLEGFHSGKYNKGAKLIIGKWGTSAGDKNYKLSIPIKSITRVENLQ